MLSLVEDTLAQSCRARKRATLVAAVNAVPRGAGRAPASARERVEEALEAAAEELKESAFASTFVFPTVQLFRCVGNRIMESDVDVHGANLYAALLFQLLGVKLARSVMVDDDVKGVCDFLSVPAFYPALKQLWKRANCGKHVVTPVVPFAAPLTSGFSFVFRVRSRRTPSPLAHQYSM